MNRGQTLENKAEKENSSQRFLFLLWYVKFSRLPALDTFFDLSRAAAKRAGHAFLSLLPVCEKLL
jgi:hypothetical protein